MILVHVSATSNICLFNSISNKTIENASPSQGYPRNKFVDTHLLYTWVERGTVRVKSVSCPRTQHNTSPPGQGLNPNLLIRSRAH